ncbi:unnamed protein product [Acholeplasma phage MV-L51]|uniref:Uncharacterized protein n=1 Tax=Acholeplasma phage MV-L51 TaxID=1977403 RepID=Q04391_9VIRU|nr:hypothetical protein L1_1 [Acholeplasma phage MV-L51]CAA41648.1 unnamed protein product [Acholeplasma phage MV-L51]
MEYIEITVNKSQHFVNTDQIYNMLWSSAIMQCLISNEYHHNNNEHTSCINRINRNYRSNQRHHQGYNDLYDSINIIQGMLENLNASIVYFTKDGKYKLIMTL